jgi:hypothetical protein
MESSDAVLSLSPPSEGGPGRCVRVAVIDSGVNPRHPHICGLEGGICVAPDGVVTSGDYSDYLGHGTAVTAAIQEKAPEAKYFAIRLFQTSLRSTIDGLIGALEWAIEQKMDVVNLSLGTRNSFHAPRFEPLISRANEQGTLIVAAREANGELCYPGSLPGVINVGLDWEVPRETYQLEQLPEGPIFFASGYPRSLPGMSRERNLHGISFAVANMCGFVIHACAAAETQSFDAISAALVAGAVTSPAP